MRKQIHAEFPEFLNEFRWHAADESWPVCCSDDVTDDAVEWRRQLSDARPRPGDGHSSAGCRRSSSSRRRVDGLRRHRLVSHAGAQRHATPGGDEPEEQLRKLRKHLFQMNPPLMMTVSYNIPNCMRLSIAGVRTFAFPDTCARQVPPDCHSGRGRMSMGASLSMAGVRGADVPVQMFYLLR